MLVLVCVCEGHVSRTVYFAIVAFDFVITAPSIKIEILSLLCVFEGQFSKTLCFAIAAFDFFTTAPSFLSVCLSEVSFYDVFLKVMLSNKYIVLLCCDSSIRIWVPS